MEVCTAWWQGRWTWGAEPSCWAACWGSAPWPWYSGASLGPGPWTMAWRWPPPWAGCTGSALCATLTVKKTRIPVSGIRDIGYPLPLAFPCVCVAVLEGWRVSAGTFRPEGELPYWCFFIPSNCPGWELALNFLLVARSRVGVRPAAPASPSLNAWPFSWMGTFSILPSSSVQTLLVSCCATSAGYWQWAQPRWVGETEDKDARHFFSFLGHGFLGCNSREFRETMESRRSPHHLAFQCGVWLEELSISKARVEAG